MLVSALVLGCQPLVLVSTLVLGAAHCAECSESAALDCSKRALSEHSRSWKGMLSPNPMY